MSLEGGRDGREGGRQGGRGGTQITRALLRLERTMNLLCHLREEGRGEWEGGREGRK